MNKDKITVEELKDYCKYDELTGRFTVISARRGSVVGRFAESQAGTTGKGYRMISVNSKRDMAHRLAYLYMIGEHVPEGMEMDHINNDPSDNRWSNLRLCSHSDNLKNTKVKSTNELGVKGISKFKKTRFRARIKIEGKEHTIGYYDTLAEAEQAMKSFREELHKDFTNHG